MLHLKPLNASKHNAKENKMEKQLRTFNKTFKTVKKQEIKSNLHTSSDHQNQSVSLYTRTFSVILPPGL